MSIIGSEHGISYLVRMDGPTKTPSRYLGQRPHVGGPPGRRTASEREFGTARLSLAAGCALAEWEAPAQSVRRPSRARYERLSRTTHVAAGSQIALFPLSRHWGFIAQSTNLLSRGTWAAGD